MPDGSGTVDWDKAYDIFGGNDATEEVGEKGAKSLGGGVKTQAIAGTTSKRAAQGAQVGGVEGAIIGGTLGLVEGFLKGEAAEEAMEAKAKAMRAAGEKEKRKVMGTLRKQISNLFANESKF